MIQYQGFCIYALTSTYTDNRAFYVGYRESSPSEILEEVTGNRSIGTDRWRVIHETAKAKGQVSLIPLFCTPSKQNAQYLSSTTKFAFSRIGHPLSNISVLSDGPRLVSTINSLEPFGATEFGSDFIIGAMKKAKHPAIRMLALKIKEQAVDAWGYNEILTITPEEIGE